MKILNDKPKLWKMKVVCTGKGNEEENYDEHHIPCGRALEINIYDVYITNLFRSSYGESPEVVGKRYTFMCPCCGSETDIPAIRLPKHVRIQAKFNNKPEFKENKKVDEITM